MLIDLSRLLLLSFIAALRRAWLLLDRGLVTVQHLAIPDFLAQFGCARRLETLARRLATMNGKMELVRAQLHSGQDTAAIEADLTFRRMLAVVKTDMRALQCEAAAWQCDRSAGPCTPRLRAALQAVTRITAQVHGLADELLWELGERDRLHAGAAGNQAPRS